MKPSYSGRAEEPILISESATDQSASNRMRFQNDFEPIYVSDKDLTIASTLGNHFINDDEEGFADESVALVAAGMEDGVQQTQNPTEKFNFMAERFKSLTQSLKLKMMESGRKRADFGFGFGEGLLDDQSETGMFLEKIQGSEVLKTGINVLPLGHSDTPHTKGSFSPFSRSPKLGDFGGRRARKTKRGGKQYAMRKGTTKIIDELKNFEGFSKIAKKLKDPFEEFQRENREEERRRADEGGLAQTLMSLNQEIKKSIERRQDEAAERAGEREEPGPEARHTMEGGIEQSIDFDEDREPSRDEEQLLCLEAEQSLIRPEVYQKILKSSIFNPKLSTRNLDFLENECENQKKAKAANEAKQDPKKETNPCEEEQKKDGTPPKEQKKPADLQSKPQGTTTHSAEIPQANPNMGLLEQAQRLLEGAGKQTPEAQPKQSTNARESMHEQNETNSEEGLRGINELLKRVRAGEPKPEPMELKKREQPFDRVEAGDFLSIGSDCHDQKGALGLKGEKRLGQNMLGEFPPAHKVFDLENPLEQSFMARPKRPARFRNWVNRNYDIDGEKLLDENFLQMQKIGVEFVKKRKYRRRKTNSRKFTGFNSVEDSPTDSRKQVKQFTFDLVEDVGDERPPRHARMFLGEINCDEVSADNSFARHASGFLVEDSVASRHPDTGINLRLKEMDSSAERLAGDQARLLGHRSELLLAGNVHSHSLGHRHKAFSSQRNVSRNLSLNFGGEGRATLGGPEQAQLGQDPFAQAPLVDLEGFVDPHMVKLGTLERKRDKEVMEVSEEHSPHRKPRNRRKKKTDKQSRVDPADEGVFVESEEKSLEDEFRTMKISKDLADIKREEGMLFSVLDQSDRLSVSNLPDTPNNTIPQLEKTLLTKKEDQKKCSSDQVKLQLQLQPSLWQISKHPKDPKSVASKTSPERPIPENNLSIKERSQRQLSKSCMSIPSESKSHMPMVPHQTPINTTMLSNVNVQNLSPKTVSNLGLPLDTSVATNPVPPNPNTSNNKGPDLLSCSPTTPSNNRLLESTKTAKSLVLDKKELSQVKRRLSEQSRDSPKKPLIKNSNQAGLVPALDSKPADQERPITTTPAKSEEARQTPNKGRSPANGGTSERNTSQVWKSEHDANSPSSLGTSAKKPQLISSEKKAPAMAKPPRVFQNTAFHSLQAKANFPHKEHKTRRYGQMIPLNEDDDDEDDEDEFDYRKQGGLGQMMSHLGVMDSFHGMSQSLRTPNTSQLMSRAMSPHLMGNLGIPKMGFPGEMGVPMRPLNMTPMNMRFGSYMDPEAQSRYLAQTMERNKAQMSSYSRMMEESKDEDRRYYYRQQSPFPGHFGQKRY